MIEVTEQEMKAMNDATLNEKYKEVRAEIKRLQGLSDMLKDEKINRGKLKKVQKYSYIIGKLVSIPVWTPKGDVFEQRYIVHIYGYGVMGGMSSTAQMGSHLGYVFLKYENGKFDLENIYRSTHDLDGTKKSDITILEMTEEEQKQVAEFLTSIGDYNKVTKWG